jgi:hypothetical protein
MYALCVGCLLHRVQFSSYAVRYVHGPAVHGGIILCLLVGSPQINVPGLVPLCLTVMFYLYESWLILRVAVVEHRSISSRFVTRRRRWVLVLTTIACHFIEVLILTYFEHCGYVRTRRMRRVMGSSSSVLPRKTPLLPTLRSCLQSIYFFINLLYS